MTGEKKPGFLFVNKNAESLYLSKFDHEREKTLKQQVYEHVQRSRDLEEERRTRTRPRKKRKPVVRINQHSTTLSHTQPSHVVQEPGTFFVSSNSPTHTSPTATLTAGLESLSCRTVPRTRRQDHGTNDAKYRTDEERRTRRRVQVASSLSRYAPKNATTDPFNARVTAIPLTEKNVSIFVYFETQMFPAVTRQDSPNIVDSSPFDAKQLLQECHKDPLHIYALLAGACARIKCVKYRDFEEPKMPDLHELFLVWASKQRGKTEKLDPETELKDIRALSIVYKQRSYGLLKIVHDTIKRGDHSIINEQLIQTLYFIWTMESYRRNWDAVTQIRQYLFALCKQKWNGITELPSHLQKMLYFADRFHAHATDDVPLIQAPFRAQKLSDLQWDIITEAIRSGPRQLSGGGRVELMGSALRKFSVYFSDDFEQRMVEMSQLSCVLQCHWTEAVAASIKSQEYFAEQHIEHSLLPGRGWVMKSTYNLSDHLLYEKSRHGTPSAVQELIRVALIVWLAFITVPITGIPTSETSSESPQKAKSGRGYDVRVTVRVDPLQKQFQALLSSAEHAVRTMSDFDVGTSVDAGIRFTGASAFTERDASQSLLLWAAGLGVLACGEFRSNEANRNLMQKDPNEFKGMDIQFFCAHFVRLACQMNIASWEMFDTICKANGFPWLGKLESAQDWRLYRILEELRGQFFLANATRLAHELDLTSWDKFDEMCKEKGFPWAPELKSAQDWQLDQMLAGALDNAEYPP